MSKFAWELDDIEFIDEDDVAKLNQDSAHLWDIEKFDPNQLRDEQGRWTDEGGASAAQLLRLHSTGNETMADVEKQLTPEDIARINAAEESLKGKGTTMSQYKDANGVYSPERAALHQKIVDGMFTPEKVAAATPAPGETPTLTMTGGRPAAGKTSALRDELKDVNDKSFYLSADEIQEKLPGYRGDHAGLFNGEAQDITAQAEKVARAARLNITYDATMKTGKTALERVKEYKDDGYKVNAYFVHTSPLTSAVRSVQRFKSSGRYVPPVVSLSSKSNESTFDSLKPHVDKWALYDNNGGAPQLIARGTGLSKAFDPSEARDKDGKWTTEGVAAALPNKTYTGTQSPHPYFIGKIVDNPLPLSKQVTPADLKTLPSDFFRRNAPTEDVAIKSLHVTQDYITPERVADYLKPKSEQPYGLTNLDIATARVGGERVVIDGNHRVMAAKLHGDRTVHVADYGSWTVHNGEWKRSSK